jgi:hypothetical protein
LVFIESVLQGELEIMEGGHYYIGDLKGSRKLRFSVKLDSVETSSDSSGFGDRSDEDLDSRGLGN